MIQVHIKVSKIEMKKKKIGNLKKKEAAELSETDFLLKNVRLEFF